jgi:hypothetical protein
VYTRQKVKSYFLPVYIAKKGKQSSPFFGGKTTKPHVRTGVTLGLHGLKPGFAWLQTQDNPAKSRFLLFDVSLYNVPTAT